MRRISSHFNRIRRDSRGVAVAEYGLVAAIAGAAIAVASLALGSAVTSSIETAPAVAPAQSAR